MKRILFILFLFNCTIFAQVNNPGWTSSYNIVYDSLIIGDRTLKGNADEGVLEFTTDVDGVVNQIGLEDMVRVYNNTGGTISNGTAVAFNGTHTDYTPLIIKASAATKRLAVGFFGIATEDIANGAYGFITERGLVRDIDTDSLVEGQPIYISSASGEMTSTKPAHPNYVVLVGGCQKKDASTGVIFIEKSLGLLRQLLVKNYSFTSNGVGAGVYYKAGYYESSAADANLDEGSLTQTFGTSDIDYEAHAFIVTGGAGTVDAGVVGLRTSGTSINDDGTQIPGSIDTILTDITSVLVDEYYEAEKYLGTVTFELFVMSGTPTAYSLDFNYGYCKYEDFGNRDFYMVGIECLWQGGATDATGFDIELFHHNNLGWTYSAAAFEPGGTVLESRAADHVGFLGVLNGVDAAWKRADLTTFIDGNGSEGIVIKVTTGANNTIQIQDLHIGVALD